MPTARGSINTQRSSSSSRGNPKKLSPTVRKAAQASSQMSHRGGKANGKGGKGRKGKKDKVIGHRMERVAPPGGRTTINLGGFGEEGEGSSVLDSPSSTDVHVPRYADGKIDKDDSRGGGGGGGGGGGSRPPPHVSKLPINKPKSSAPNRKINHGGGGQEYTSYNPYNTRGNVITIDDLPTEGLMITTPRGVPLKDCVNATRKQIDDAASRWNAPDQTHIGGNPVRSARQLRNSFNGGDSRAASEQQKAETTPPKGANEFGSGARRIQPPGGHSTFKF